jgi:hypothetical protein
MNEFPQAFSKELFPKQLKKRLHRNVRPIATSAGRCKQNCMMNLLFFVCELTT